MATLQDYERDYWADDREQVLAQLRAQEGGTPNLSTPGGPIDGSGRPQLAPAGAAPAGGGYQQGQDPAAYFQSLIQNLPGTTQSLLSIEGQLGQAGIRVLRNAAGVAGKVQMPNGQIVDVLNSAGLGGKGWQWLTGDGGQGGGQDYGGGITGPPGFSPFSYQPFQPGAPFTAPQLNESTDPGYQARLAMGTDALQKAAAARGTLGTSGTLKDLTQFAQDYASNEYGNVFNRAMGAYGMNFNNALNAYNTNYQTAFQPWQANFNNAYQSWQGGLGAQNQRYNQLFGASNLGLAGIGGAANAGSNYANNVGNILTNQAGQAGDLITGGANATAAGQAAGGAAAGSAYNNIGNAINMGLLYRNVYGAPTTNPGTQTPQTRVVPLPPGGGQSTNPGFTGWSPINWGPGNEWMSGYPGYYPG